MWKKMPSSKTNEMKVLFSKIDEARELAKRLEKFSEEAESATQKRDAALYQFFANVHYLEKRLGRLQPPRSKLEEKYGRLPRSAIAAVLKLAYRGLNSKRQSKYAAVLRYVREKKRPGQSVKSLIRSTGGINKCVTAEKKLRSRARKGWGPKR
jgi:hypothetical protein